MSGLCEHVWSVVNTKHTSFPLSLIVSEWRSLALAGAAVGGGYPQAMCQAMRQPPRMAENARRDRGRRRRGRRTDGGRRPGCRKHTLDG